MVASCPHTACVSRPHMYTCTHMWSRIHTQHVCTCHRVHTQLHAHSRTRPGVGSWVHTLLVAGIRLLVLCCTHYWEHREPQDVCWNCIAYTIGLAGRLVDGVRLFVFLDCGVSILFLSLFLSFFLSLSLSLGCGIALLSFLCVASGVVCCVASCCFLCGSRCLSLPCVASSFHVNFHGLDLMACDSIRTPMSWAFVDSSDSVWGPLAGMCAYMDILVFLFFATMVCDWFVVAWVTELFNQKACRPGWVKRLCPWHRFGIAQRMAKHVFKNKSVASLLGRSNGDEMFWFWLNVKARMRVK